MIHIDAMLKEYPARLHGFRENILKEYLQYRILDILYGSPYADRLIFLGGTAIRIVHNGVRFSEDLDFDNLGLNETDFEHISKIIADQLSLDGYEVELRNVFKGAYHCYIRFPGLLFEHGLSGYKEERILIQIDAQPQEYHYDPEKFLINKLGFFRYINTVPAALLLSQKIFACLNRPRAKGRDFFDVTFLMPMTEPDYVYLNQKAGIAGKEDLARALLKKVSELNMKDLARDVEPFLFDSSQKERVSCFADTVTFLMPGTHYDL